MIHNDPPKPENEKTTVSHVVEKPVKPNFDNSVLSDHPDKSQSLENQSMLNSKYELLSGYIDGELTQQETQKVSLLLEKDTEYKELHEEMAAMRQEVQSLSLQESELEHLDRLFAEPVAKTTRVFGFALVAISATILAVFILYSMFINSAISLLVKLAVSSVCIGSLFLLFSVLRQRIKTNKNDKYNRVKI